MCRTVHAVLSTAICGVQMLVRVFMTIILMIENLIRMILQTLYNFISFMLQMISLIPICVVFLVTARLKCFMCGGGGPCPVNRGGACDCLMSAAALIILFFIFRATGVLDKIFYKIGYVQAPPIALVRFVPTPGDITECSRNDTVTMPEATSSTEKGFMRMHYMDYTTETEIEEDMESTSKITEVLTKAITRVTKKMKVKSSLRRNVVAPMNHFPEKIETTFLPNPIAAMLEDPELVTSTQKMNVTFPPISDTDVESTFPANMTTVLYYLV